MKSSDLQAYQHPHVFHYTGTQAQARTMRVVLLTVVMMVAEIVAGWIFKSMALFADGCHMSTHAAALGISWLAFVLARRYQLDQRFAFGTWKIEILGGFVSAILLGAVGVGMVVLSINRLAHPVPIQFNEAIFVAVVGLLVNIASMFLLTGRHAHDHAHTPTRPHAHTPDHVHTGHKHEHHRHRQPEGHESVRGNLNLRAAYVHVMADALTSVLAILALLGGKFMNWVWLDPAVGLIGAAMVLQWTVSLLRDTGSILLDREADETTARAVREAIEHDADTHVTDLHVWRVGQGRYACIASVVALEPRSLDHYRARLRVLGQIVHVTLEIVKHEATQIL